MVIWWHTVAIDVVLLRFEVDMRSYICWYSFCSNSCSIVSPQVGFWKRSIYLKVGFVWYASQTILCFINYKGVLFCALNLLYLFDLQVCGSSNNMNLPPNFWKLPKDVYTPDAIAASDCMLGQSFKFFLLPTCVSL